QAEGGIRDWSVTGVQTCALPICQFALGVSPGAPSFRPLLAKGWDPPFYFCCHPERRRPVAGRRSRRTPIARIPLQNPLPSLRDSAVSTRQPTAEAVGYHLPSRTAGLGHSHLRTSCLCLQVSL